jgi:mRNA interferase MazF
VTRSHAGLGTVIRGRVYGAEIEDRGEKYYLAVSNNRRNAALSTFLAVRLTTTPKPALPSIVHLSGGDKPWTGAVMCDDIERIYRDEVTRDYGALPPGTLHRVEDALRAALAL